MFSEWNEAEILSTNIAGIPEQSASRKFGKIHTVGNFVTVKAPENRKLQQLSTSGLQQVQYQSLRINRFQQISIGSGIWFGIR